MINEPLLTPDELAILLGVKVVTIYDYVKREELPFLRVGRLLRFDRQVITDWIAARIRKNPVKE
jgi:excisionase family DNA binding protein